MRARSRALSWLALAFTGIAVAAAFGVPKGISPRQTLPNPHLGVAVKSFDSRWIPVTTREADILKTLRDLRLETSTMWFKVDCSDRVYDRDEIALVFEGGTVWVAAGYPKPTAPPARCLENGEPP